MKILSRSFPLLLLPLLLSPPTSAVAEPVISTVAGTGEVGYSGDGGKAVEAQLNNPFGVIVAPDGDIVFCDTINHVIRKISRRKGDIVTLAGTGKKGYTGDGGPPEKADLFEPYELRYHPSGDLYWVEMQNNIVRRLDARRHVVETVAGTGEKGFGGDGGSALEAKMNRPHSIVFDESGENLYICDIGNHRIRRVELASGTITTWCGTGEPKPTKDGASVGPGTPLKGPRAFDRAPNGDLWLALREGNQVFRIDMETQTLHHIAGTGKKGFHAEDRPALESELSGPKGVAISPDGSLVYLADTESHTVRVIDLNESPPLLRLVAGTGEKGDGPDGPDPLACKMARLHGVGIDPVTGDLYIGDSEAHKVRVVKGLGGTGETKPGPLASYKTDTFEMGGRACKVTKPAAAAAGNPWIWRCRFYGAFPSVDEGLLAAGWHVAWVDVGHLFGGPEAMRIFDRFYEEVVKRYGLAENPVMEGFSRGGLTAMNWSILHPDKVAGIYLDSPVLDIHSWPKGQSEDLWAKSLDAYSLDRKTADEWKGPLARLGPLAKAGVPIFVVAGGADKVVPFPENSAILEERYGELGGDFTVIVKAGAGHHPHSLHDPTPVIEWARRVVDRK